MNKRPWLGGLGLSLVGGGVFSFALRRASRRWIEPPRVVLDPPTCDSVEEVHFASLDGTPLYGWHLRAAAADPLLVLCHGYQRSIEETFSIGRDLSERGFNVLLFDFRGCGRSGGRYTSLGYHEPLDVRGAVQWLWGRHGNQRPVGVLGISMGGASTLMAAVDEPLISAIVSDSAFATLQGAVDLRFAPLSFPKAQLYRLSMLAAEVMCGGRVRDVRPVDAAARLGDRPVLLIHGRLDAVAPFEHAEQLNAALSGPHELWALDGVYHAMARFAQADAYLERVSSFFRRHLVAADRLAV